MTNPLLSLFAVIAFPVSVTVPYKSLNSPLNFTHFVKVQLAKFNFYLKQTLTVAHDDAFLLQVELMSGCMKLYARQS